MSDYSDLKQKHRDAHIDALSEITGIEYSEAEREAIHDAQRWAEITVIQIADWVKNCHRLSKLLVDRKAGISDTAWFWIVLFGLFREVLPYIEQHAKYFGAPTDGIAIQIQKIRSLLTEDELIYVDYLRQEMSHPVTHALKIKVKKPRSADTSALLDDTYRGRKVSELNQCVKSILERTAIKYQVHISDAEHYVAYDFALRTEARLRELADVVHKWAST